MKEKLKQTALNSIIISLGPMQNVCFIVCKLYTRCYAEQFD